MAVTAKMPAEAAYRVNTEALVKSRLALVDKVNMNIWFIYSIDDPCNTHNIIVL